MELRCDTWFLIKVKSSRLYVVKKYMPATIKIKYSDHENYKNLNYSLLHIANVFLYKVFGRKAHQLFNSNFQSLQLKSSQSTCQWLLYRFTRLAIRAEFIIWG